MKRLLIFSLLLLFGIHLTNAQGPNTNSRSGEKVTESGINIPEDKTVQPTYAFTGYYNITEIGFLAGATYNMNPAPFSFMTINGWHITEKLAAGIGIGAEFMSESYMPVVLDLRYYLRQGSFSPYFFLQGGYNIALDETANESIIYNHYHLWPDLEYGQFNEVKVKGGLLFNPGFGVKNMFNENFGMVFNVGYRIQRLNYERNENSMLQLNQNRLVIKIGIIFK